MKIAVIGGGASGLTAAIAAARNGAQVTVFERNDKVGKKILVTGNGKCNISNVSLSEEFYYSEDRDFVVSAFNKFGFDETMSYFKGLGLLLTEKRGGIYPYSEQASAVLDALRFEAESLNVVVNTDCMVTCIEHTNKNDYRIDYEHFIRIEEDKNKSSSKEKNKSTKNLDVKNKDVKNKDIKNKTVVSVENKKMYFDRVIISTGGKAAPKTGSDGNGYKLVEKLGINVTKTYPALIGLRCSGDFWKSISGVRCNAQVIVAADGKVLAKDRGELQLTDYGVSGIPVFQVSRTASKALDEKRKVSVTIDFMPDISADELISECNFRLLLVSDRTKEQFFNGFFNKKLVIMFLKTLGLNPNDRITIEDIERVVGLVKAFKANVVADNGFDQAQVTAGGVPLHEINENFESKKHKGLFLTGEILDVDGKCGGYNLQWAWTCGYIAGEAAAKC
ncbi:MAG: aminoacetone oxidase family FAD-binding enzyme [Lachnospiraceae bacterium]|nr:aminoacetone oxidase family FAD-binding enzyme [Lachnospiraceae bacterium]